MAYYKITEEDKTIYYNFQTGFKRKLIEKEGSYKGLSIFEEEESDMNPENEIEESEYKDKAKDVTPDLIEGSHPPSSPH